MNPLYFPDLVAFWDAIFGIGTQLDAGHRGLRPSRPDSWYDIVCQVTLARLVAQR